ncbi:FAD:protein FMN transferase [Litorivita sp. NS0012-18]|uniref:FAD:protein FMN transferase n=1 Tax=Litorivita sp. NS0012-18 TaxID=3127655 RepID=UPI0031022793
MSLTRRRFLSITAAGAIAGSAATARSVPARWQGTALGAEAQVTLYGMETEALRAVPHLLAQIEQQFSLYDQKSTLSLLNRAKSLRQPPRYFADLLTLCGEMHGATGGRFDPTVQPLWHALARGQDIAAARASIGFDRVQVTPDHIAIGAEQALTLNGIAQGFATDLVTAYLRDLGAREVLVNIGEYRALGGPFRLGLSDPALDLHGWQSLTGTALATSSPAALRLGPDQGHVLDPLGLAPALWSSVTVEAETAAVADALSTAMCHMDGAQIDAVLARRADAVRVILVSFEGEVGQRRV